MMAGSGINQRKSIHSLFQNFFPSFIKSSQSMFDFCNRTVINLKVQTILLKYMKERKNY